MEVKRLFYVSYDSLLLRKENKCPMTVSCDPLLLRKENNCLMTASYFKSGRMNLLLVSDIPSIAPRSFSRFPPTRPRSSSLRVAEKPKSVFYQRLSSACHGDPSCSTFFSIQYKSKVKGHTFVLVLSSSPHRSGCLNMRTKIRCRKYLCEKGIEKNLPQTSNPFFLHFSFQFVIMCIITV